MMANFAPVSEDSLMFVNDPRATMTDAAQQFVSAAFPDRKIGQWRGEHFQLVDGVKWYRVRMVKTGWEVFEADYTPSKGGA
jgi:hypothetical protein